MPFLDSKIAQSGRFTDIRLLGRGGAGHVYYALDVLLKRPVAIKEVLPTEQDFQKTLSRFKHESQIQARVGHPNITAVYNLEEDDRTGEYYLICEYANAGTLAEYLEKYGPLNKQLAVQIALDILAALHKTWSEQIVHGDLKPTNILLFEDGSGNITAKLSDFGIAQDLRRTTTTLPGTCHPGTPLYMAPEQWDATKLLDVRADIYALGITLFEALTGKHYKSEAQGSALDIRAYNLAVSPATVCTIQRAVREDRTDRYQNPEDMARDLRAVLSDDTMTRSCRVPSQPSRDDQPIILWRSTKLAWMRFMSTIVIPMLLLASSAPSVEAVDAPTTILYNYWHPHFLGNVAVAREEDQQQARQDGYVFGREEATIYTTQRADTIPLWLYYHNGRKDYLTAATEDMLQKAEAEGYTRVRVEGYIYPTKHPGTVPLWLYYHTGRMDYFSTAADSGIQKALQNGYHLVGVAGYVLPGSPVSKYTSLTVTWDFGATDGAVDFNLCSDPQTNKNAVTGLCNKANVTNIHVGVQGSRVQPVEINQQYRVCLLVANLPERPDRWFVCKEFTASFNSAFSFTKNDLHSISQR